MSADVLREAAAKMRERAEHSPAGSPWGVSSSRTSHRVVDNERSGISMAVADVFPTGGSEHQRWMAEHIAGWHPAVALAVADWLDEEFAQIDLFGAEHPEPRCECSAHTVARAYLGREA